MSDRTAYVATCPICLRQLPGMDRKETASDLFVSHVDTEHGTCADLIPSEYVKKHLWHNGCDLGEVM